MFWGLLYCTSSDNGLHKHKQNMITVQNLKQSGKRTLWQCSGSGQPIKIRETMLETRTRILIHTHTMFEYVWMNLNETLNPVDLSTSSKNAWRPFRPTKCPRDPQSLPPWTTQSPPSCKISQHSQSRHGHVTVLVMSQMSLCRLCSMSVPPLPIVASPSRPLEALAAQWALPRGATPPVLHPKPWRLQQQIDRND